MYVTGEWLSLLIHNEARTRAALQTVETRDPALIIRQYCCMIVTLPTFMNERITEKSGPFVCSSVSFANTLHI
jgi:hypothetical protein